MPLIDRRSDGLRLWPAPKVGTGPALNKREAGERLGISLAAVEMAIRRTRLGQARFPFPQAEGRAVHPDSRRAVEVPWWRERTIIAYGKRAGILDEKTGAIRKQGKAE